MIWLLMVVVGGIAAWMSRRMLSSRARLAAERGARLQLEVAQVEAQAIRGASKAESAAVQRQAELDVRAANQAARQEVERERETALAELSVRELEMERSEHEVARRAALLEERATELGAREQTLRERETDIRARREEAQKTDGELRKTIERVAGETGADIKQRLVGEWIEEARTSAAERLRRVDASVNDPEHGRTAKRIMGIASQRYHGHYLTERLLTNLPIPLGQLPRIAGTGEENLRIIEEVSHVKLTPGETGESIRLEGQDSFGREIARRAISRFGRTPPKTPADARKSCVGISEELEREVMDLGKRAFKELEIPRAHPDIVKLVGRLNWRTSYTQNQWKHAVEASFLCGMMASELGLDVKLARRAALMHDIGKALTHEIDGSHAVIGADLARKLGESEAVANAIGAHHTDEPFNSSYALLVAAADAMSGARPGARRQQDENYVERLEELERIASNYSGVERVYAVQGGREVRVHVQESRVSDIRAVELSTEIAHQISDQLTFPGQIKVTVIREVRAVEIAG